VQRMGTGPLMDIPGTLEGDDYAQLLLDNIPQVKAALNVETASYIQDHPHVHNTPNVQRAKQTLGLRDLNLPTYSPDLNIIENMWSVLKTRVANRAPQTKNDIIEIAFDKWANIQLEDIRTYFYSIPNRLQHVIEADGGHTKY
jgi:hypothetical protein